MEEVGARLASVSRRERVVAVSAVNVPEACACDW